MKDHNLVESFPTHSILVEQRTVRDRSGMPVQGLHNLWITLNNPAELNSYTTNMLKEIVLALRAASNDRSAVAVVITGSGSRSFCTGGNTREYAEVYAGNPGEYRQYMRLFNDMVTAVLQCDKPVICRVNGMRVGGGQEVGMACDFSVASDLAVFSQAGPRHGSAPDGGSTDFLPVFVGMERAMFSGTLCQPWSAHRFYWLGGLTQVVPALKIDGQWVANPLVITDRVLDEYGRLAIGEWKAGAERERGKTMLAKGTVDLALLDEAVDELCLNLLYTMPDCLAKTIESLRKHKLEHWDRNRETNRAWLALNMMTEARAGFRAFHYGSKEQREVDFIRLRQRLADGASWSDELIEEIAPWTAQAVGAGEIVSDTRKVRLEFEHDGQVARVTLAAPKANVIDKEMMGGVESAFDQAAARRELKAIVLIGEGTHFSFGASVQEHLPEHIVATLTRLHALLRRIAEAPAPTIAAVRGQCLGGGLEVALACDLILAEEAAQFGCPEIQLGVFPPAASAILPVRIGAGPASRLVLSGASVTGTVAAEMGLVTRTAADGRLETTLAEWLTAEFLPRSAAALRFAARAIRRPVIHALEHDLPWLERIYLDDLMREPDAIEGIRAFLEKAAAELAARRSYSVSPELGTLIDRVQALHDDLDLQVVRSWKRAMPGRKAIGHMPIYVPRELIHAAGMLPVGIVGAGERLEIIRGDAYFQSYICHIPRSTIELALTRRLDVLDGMLFPSICDVIRNLSGMWNILFPDRYVRYVDLPQNFDRNTGGVYWRRELERLRDDFGGLAGQPIDDDSLRHSIVVYNENRSAIRELYAVRSRQPWSFPTSEVYLMLRAANVLPPEEHTALVRKYLRLAPLESDRCDRDQSRIVLVGMFCEQPPLGLLLTLERAGCWVVDDDLLLGLRWISGNISTEGDLLEALVDAFLTQSAETAARYLPDGEHGRALVDSVRRNRAEGVIFCAPSFCDPALLEQPMLVARLDRAGIPHTQFKYCEDTGQFAVIREQAGTFSDSIRLWSEA